MKGYSKKGKYYGDALIRKAVKNTKGGKYSLMGKGKNIEKNNCQDWTARVRDEYGNLEKGLLEGLKEGNLSKGELKLLGTHAKQMKDNTSDWFGKWSDIEKKVNDALNP